MIETGRNRPRIETTIVPAGGLMLAVLVSCASGVDRRPAEDVSGPYQAAFTRQAPLDAAFYGAGAIVRAEVVNVDGPFWNQASGQKWDLRPGIADDYTVPVLYREITLEIRDVLRDELGLDAGPLTLLALGGGTDAEREVLGPDAFFGGRFVVGEEIHAMIHRRAFMMREGPVDAFMTVLHRKGVFRERSGLLYSDSPQWHSGIEPEVFGASIAASRGIEREEWDWLRRPDDAARIRHLLRLEKEIVEPYLRMQPSREVEPSDVHGLDLTATGGGR